MKKLLVLLLTMVIMVNSSAFAIEPIQTEEMEIASLIREYDISPELINELKEVYSNQVNANI